MVKFKVDKLLNFLEQISHNASSPKQLLQNLAKDFRSLSSEEQKILSNYCLICLIKLAVSKR